MKKIIALMMAALMVVAMLAACGETSTSKTDSSEVAKADATEAVATADEAATVADLDAVKAKGKLVVGITDYPPCDYKDTDGKWVGFDADLAKAFGTSLGVEVEFVEIEWANKILELNGGTIDCVWNGMTLTDEVTSAMSCSDPYFNNSQVIIVKKDVADKYAKAEDCSGLNFAVEKGSAGQKQAEAYGFTFTEVDTQSTALMEAGSGTCDGAIVDILMAVVETGEGTGYEQLTYTASLNSENLGVGFRKGSDLTAKCNEFFASARADGTLKQIAETYGVQDYIIL